MEEKPTRLLAELRAPEHRPSLLAFSLVAIVCSLVVATGIRLDTVGGVLNPLPSLVFTLGQDLIPEEEPGLRAFQAGSELEPEGSVTPAPTTEPEARPDPVASAAGSPASARPREGHDSGAASAQGKGPGGDRGRGGAKGKGRDEPRDSKGSVTSPGNGNGAANGNGPTNGNGAANGDGRKPGKGSTGPDKISVSGGAGAGGPSTGASRGEGREQAPGQLKKSDRGGTPPGHAKGRGGPKRR